MTKKRFFIGLLVMLLVFGMMVASCDDDANQNNQGPRTIDSRLVGGNWSLVYNSLQFYRFTEDTYGIASNGETSIILTPAYTSDGRVLAMNGDTVLLDYEFVPGSRFDDEMAAVIASGNHHTILSVETKRWLANSGNMVRFTVAGSTQSFEWARWGNLP
jgi:hypothetical protein